MGVLKQQLLDMLESSLPTISDEETDDAYDEEYFIRLGELISTTKGAEVTGPRPSMEDDENDI